MIKTLPFLEMWEFVNVTTRRNCPEERNSQAWSRATRFNGHISTYILEKLTFNKVVVRIILYIPSQHKIHFNNILPSSFTSPK